MSVAIASRVIRSTPYRDSTATWEYIVKLLTQGSNDFAQQELHAVSGIAASIITDQAPKDAAIVVTCEGPRTRIYCRYDDDAIDGSDSKEDALSYDPLKGNWAISLPCEEEELDWVQRALKSKSVHITARNKSETLGSSDNGLARTEELTLDIDRFLGS